MTGKQFRNARRRLGLSQREMGARLGVGKQQVYKIEAGLRSADCHYLAVKGLLYEHNLSFQEVKRICGAGR